MIAAITTARLVLQPIDQAAAARIVAGDYDDFPAAPGWPQDDTIVGLRLELDRGSTPACWLIVCAGTVIGELGWKGGPSPEGTAEIGYGIVPDHRRQGYATEAVAGFVRWAADSVELRRLVAETRDDNLASQKVLAACGFRVSSKQGEEIYWLRETAAS